MKLSTMKVLFTLLILWVFSALLVAVWGGNKEVVATMMFMAFAGVLLGIVWGD